MRMKMWARGAALAAMLTIAAPATAEMATATEAQITSLLQAKGLQAQVTKTEQGGIEIKSAASGAQFFVSLLNCDEGTAKNCKTIQLFAGWSTKEKRTLEQVNAWNKSKRFARAYLDDTQDPWLEMDVNLDFGGVAKTNLADSVDVWLSLLAQFQEDMNL